MLPGQTQQDFCPVHLMAKTRVKGREAKPWLGTLVVKGRVAESCSAIREKQVPPQPRGVVQALFAQPSTRSCQGEGKGRWIQPLVLPGYPPGTLPAQDATAAPVNSSPWCQSQTSPARAQGFICHALPPPTFVITPTTATYLQILPLKPAKPHHSS